MATDEDRFRIRPGRVRDRCGGRFVRAVRPRPKTFLVEVHRAIRRAGDDHNRLGSAGKGSGRFNARGRGAAVAAVLKGRNAWSRDASGVRTRARKLESKGLAGDELGDRLHLVIDGVDGRTHYVETAFGTTTAALNGASAGNGSSAWGCEGEPPALPTRPDRRQPLEAAADAPPRRGFGLDRLSPARRRLPMQVRMIGSAEALQR